jgi:hypothetical protein
MQNIDQNNESRVQSKKKNDQADSRDRAKGIRVVSSLAHRLPAVSHRLVLGRSSPSRHYTCEGQRKEGSSESLTRNKYEETADGCSEECEHDQDGQ